MYNGSYFPGETHVPSNAQKKQLLSPEASEKILMIGLVGILGVTGDDGYPYTVPVNYAYETGKIYFHSARTGHKLDGINRNSKVSFCVIDKDEIVPEKLTSYYRSTVAFGHARVVTDDALKLHAMQLLARKYSPGFEAQASDEIRQSWSKFIVVEIIIDHLTGKEAIELVKRREA